MATIEHNWMDVIGSNPLFNTTGWLGVTSSLGIAIGQKIDLISANPMLTFVIGMLSAIWLVMKLYLTYVQTKREKMKWFKEKEKEEKNASDKSNGGEDKE